MDKWDVFFTILSILSVTLFIGYLSADEMTHKFKNPSFSGINTSSHYLTIENQEFNRKEAIREEIKAYQEDLSDVFDELYQAIEHLEDVLHIPKRITKQIKLEKK